MKHTILAFVFLLTAQLAAQYPNAVYPPCPLQQYCDSFGYPSFSAYGATAFPAPYNGIAAAQAATPCVMRNDSPPLTVQYVQSSSSLFPAWTSLSTTNGGMYAGSPPYVAFFVVWIQPQVFAWPAIWPGYTVVPGFGGLLALPPNTPYVLETAGYVEHLNPFDHYLVAGFQSPPSPAVGYWLFAQSVILDAGVSYFGDATCAPIAP